MHAYRLETTLAADGKLVLEKIPFRAGQAIEVIILSRATHSHNENKKNAYSLRDKPIKRFENPTAPVAADDWGTTT